MANPDFPLFVLQPVFGPDQEWAALRVRGAEAVDVASVRRLCDEFGLIDSCAGLSLLFPPAALERFGADAVALGLQRDAASPAPVVLPAGPGKGPTQSLLLKILAQIVRNADTREIEMTLKRDPQLSVQLLRLVNSAAFAPNTRIKSFAHAITLLGRRQLQRWLQLLLYASQAPGAKGNPLLISAALRATLMEGLCHAAGGDQAGQDLAFMVGMFSQLEAVFTQSLAAIIEPLNLTQEIRSALLQHAGRLGELLTLVETAERGPEWVAPVLKRTGIGNEDWCRAQIAALRWTVQVSREN